MQAAVEKRETKISQISQIGEARRSPSSNLWNLCFFFFLFVSVSFAAEPKPKVAVFPIAGDASDTTRQKVGFSLRAKLDREGTYEPIDGPRMLEIDGEAKSPVKFETPLKEVQELVKGEDVDLLIWGEMNGTTLKLKVFDLNQLDPLPHQLIKTIAEPTDMRFVSQEILQTLADVKRFAHPSEEAVARDAESEQLWEKNPNLVANASFDDAKNWTVLYQAERYTPPIADALPDVDKVNIYRAALADGAIQPVLVMNLSKYCAENNGMACLSDAIPIEPNTRYRLSFKYRSDGPKLHVFVKGYTTAADINGKPTEREIYRRQVPPTGQTAGEWVTIIDDLNPQHVSAKVTSLKVDLYAYLHPGYVMFDDIVLKAVGKQTRKASDDAIKKPLTAPKGRK